MQESRKRKAGRRKDAGGRMKGDRRPEEIINITKLKIYYFCKSTMSTMKNSLSSNAQLQTSSVIRAPLSVFRYQYDNHLGSACLELDESGAIISYEEYHPFGTTSYRSGRSDTEVSLKQYKYCGKERDEESGLYYYGMRYYAPWLSRFISMDPLQFEYPELTPFQYASNNPATMIDLDGLEGVDPQENQIPAMPSDSPASPNRRYIASIPRISTESRSLWSYFGAVGNLVIDAANLLPAVINSGLENYYSLSAGTWTADITTELSNTLSAITSFFKNEYNYVSTTPIRKQLSDTWYNITSPEFTAFALSLGTGVALKTLSVTSKIGSISTTATVNTATTSTINPFGLRGGYGIFGNNGLKIGNYRMDLMYANPSAGSGAGTLLSIKQMKSGGALWRWDYGKIHSSNKMGFHSTVRFYWNGTKYGSTTQRTWYPSTFTPPFFKPLKK